MEAEELKKQSRATKRKLQRETERRQTERRQCELKCHTGWSVSDDKWIHYCHSRQRATHWTISVTDQSEEPHRGFRVEMEQSDLLSVKMASKLISSTSTLLRRQTSYKVFSGLILTYWKIIFY